MSDKFQTYASGLDSPAADAFAITPANEDLAVATRALYIGTGGDVSVVTLGGTTVLFVGVPEGSILPVRCTQVRSTDTTADDIVGLV